MIITPKLEYRVKNDGTVNIYIYLYDPAHAIKSKISTRHFINPKDWIGAEADKKLPNAGYLNNLLKKIVWELEEHALKNPDISPVDLKKWYEGPKHEIKHTPASYYDLYIQMCRDGLILHKRTKEKLSERYVDAIQGSSLYLKKFADLRSISFAGINEEFYDAFVNFHRSLGLAQNTIVKSLKHFKAIVAHAKKRGHHSNDFKEYSLSTVKSQTIRLTPAEIEAVISLDLTGRPDLIAEQERFQVAYNLLLRFGDTVAISEKNIIKKDGKYYLSAFTQKTKSEILVPIKKSVHAILKRNNFSLKAANATSNERLKTLGQLAKINSNVTITEFKDGVKTENVYKKYQLMETHTTRRSAARNLYDAGIEPNTIMTLGGWKSLKQLLEYIDIDLEHAATKVADHPFFQ